MTDDTTPDVLARLDEHDVRLDRHDGHLERHDLQIERLNTGFGVLQTGQQHILQQIAEQNGEERERSRSQKEQNDELRAELRGLGADIRLLFDATNRERGAREERQRLINRNTTWAVVVLAGLGTLLGWQEFGQTIWHAVLHLQEPAG